jgi:hypothetical protein
VLWFWHLTTDVIIRTCVTWPRVERWSTTRVNSEIHMSCHCICAGECLDGRPFLLFHISCQGGFFIILYSCCFTCRVLRNSCPQFLLWLVHVLCLHDRKLILVLVELIDVTNLRLFILFILETTYEPTMEHFIKNMCCGSDIWQPMLSLGHVLLDLVLNDDRQLVWTAKSTCLVLLV